MAYDLLQSLGLKNLVWRTPGADGGRDLEGIRFGRDFSGSEIVEKWYIECKRYQNSVDWPTIWSKIAYAETGNADFLLFLLSSQVSPNCEDEIQKWNQKNRRPTIRVWPKHDIIRLLRLNKMISLKFGMLENAEQASYCLFPLYVEIAKISQAASCAYSFDGPVGHYLTTITALTEFIECFLRRYEETQWPVLLPASRNVAVFDWVDQEGSNILVNEEALRAVLATTRYLFACERISVKFLSEQFEIIPQTPRLSIKGRGLEFLANVCLAANFEMSDPDAGNQRLQFSVRNYA